MAPVKGSRQEQELESITPGKRADIVYLDRNFFALVDPIEIADARVTSPFSMAGSCFSDNHFKDSSYCGKQS